MFIEDLKIIGVFVGELIFQIWARQTTCNSWLGDLPATTLCGFAMVLRWRMRTRKMAAQVLSWNMQRVHVHPRDL